MQQTAVRASEPETLPEFPSWCKRTQIDLSIKGRVRFDDWEALKSQLTGAEKGAPWWIGDWLVFGEEHFGEEYAQVIDPDDEEKRETKQISGETLRVYGWVAAKVSRVRRRTNLSWGHHREVAPQEPELQTAWLALAEQEGWSVHALRKAIKNATVEQPDEVVDELLVLQDPEVRRFLENYKSILREQRDVIPGAAPFLANMVDAQIGHAQWQLDRTVGEEAARILEAIDEGWQVGQEILNWLQQRSYFIREPELQTRLVYMVENKKLREVKQGGRKDNQRGDLTSMYVRYDARTGDAFSVHKGNSNYESGEDD